MRAQTWNAQCYDTKHRFVAKYGEDLLPLLDAKKGETIIDLGCGTGDLTAKIAETGARVTGLDNSEAMITEARKKYPDLDFKIADARTFEIDSRADAVFSNAALHWVLEADKTVKQIAKALKSGGRFVAEFGGKGNVEKIVSATRKSLVEMGFPNSMPTVWYFPSLGQYATLLENHGFRVVQAFHFDRPTPLEGADGLRNWLMMFKVPHFFNVPANVLPKLFDDVEKKLKPELFINDRWTADYVRLRICAIKHA